MIARPWINEQSRPARWLAGLIGSARAHESRIDLLVATRNVVRQLRRSAMGLFAVGCGVVAYLLAAGFIEWMHWGLREATIRSGLGHVQIVRAGYRDGGRADPYKYLLPDDSADRKAIGGMAGVVTVAPRFAFSGLISLGDTTLSFIAEGLTPELEGELADAVVTVEGAVLSSTDPDGIVLGRGLAAALGANVGDTVVLVSGIESGGVNAVQGKVRGMFATVSKAYDDSALRVTLPMAQRLKKASGSHEWVVLLRDTDQTDSVAASIRKRFASAALEVTAWYDLADFYNKTVTARSASSSG